ncbi:MAG: hypothetical protein HYX99_03545 [Chloroflexi bacterium]|nr:hypothetical protein [Chloroflexota bacterium]
MFWSSEGYYFMTCTQGETQMLSRALAVHRAWSSALARGLALIAVEDQGMVELDAQLERMKVKSDGGELRLVPEGLEALLNVLQEVREALKSYRKRPPSSPAQGIYGLLEDHFGEGLKDPKVAAKITGLLEALCQRIGLEAN